VEKAKALKPDLILMDVTMPRCAGPEATRLITREMPDMQIVMLSVSDDDEDLFAAIRAGAMGYLLKSIKPDELFARLRGLAEGEAPINRLMAAKILREFAKSPVQPEPRPANWPQEITEREREVLQCVAKGMSNRSARRSTSPKTRSRTTCGVSSTSCTWRIAHRWRLMQCKPD
jgi:DNA-binding NarL/FixJ family response regulator